MIKENLEQIRSQIDEAAQAAGRPADAVRLAAVSKTKPLDSLEEAVAAVQMDFGENRVQELVDKQAALPDVRWHMIGVLQRNKVKYIAPFIHLIHSVDSTRLLQEINKRAGQHERRIAVLLQIDITGEVQKAGMALEEAREILQQIESYPHIEVKGLMGMAEFTSDMQRVKSQFRKLKEAAEALQDLCGERISMDELSMGMSGDFAEAIAEGSTMVRVGSAIFGHRG